MEEKAKYKEICNLLCVDLPQGATEEFVQEYVNRHGLEFTYLLVSTCFTDYRDELMRKQRKFIRKNLPRFI